MNALFSNLGSIAGILGAIICLVAGLTRISGGYHLAGFEVQSLFMAGIALLVTGCFLKLEALSRD